MPQYRPVIRNPCPWTRMAPDGNSPLLSAPPTVVEVPAPFPHDHLAGLRDRLARLEAEGEAVTRDFVRLHGLSATLPASQADLLARIDRLVRLLESDIVRVHGLLRDTQRTLEQTESLWARAVIGALPA
jgi:hypothetical protein